MSLDFEQRCAIAAACLPKADYRTKLEALHAEMLAALAVRVPLTDDQINAVTRQQWGEQLGSAMMAHRAYARAIEAAAIANVDLTQLTTRGAVAWAGVDPQALREGN